MLFLTKFFTGEKLGNLRIKVASILELITSEKIITRDTTFKGNFTLSRREGSHVKNLGFDNELLSFGASIIKELIGKHYLVMQKHYHPDRNEGMDKRITAILNESREFLEKNFDKIVEKDERKIHNPPLKQFIDQKNEEILLRRVVPQIYSNENEISTQRIKFPITRAGVELELVPVRDLRNTKVPVKHKMRVTKSDLRDDEQELSEYFGKDKNGNLVSLTTRVIHEGSIILRTLEDGTLEKYVAKLQNGELIYEKDRNFPKTSIFASIRMVDFKSIIEKLKENHILISSLYNGLSRGDIKTIMSYISPYLLQKGHLIVRQEIDGEEVFRLIGIVTGASVPSNSSNNERQVVFHRDYQAAEIETYKKVYPNLSNTEYDKIRHEYVNFLSKRRKPIPEGIVPPIIKDYKNPLQKLGIGQNVASMPMPIFKSIIREHYTTIRKALISREMRVCPQIFSKRGRIVDSEVLEEKNDFVALRRRKKLLTLLRFFSDAYNEIDPNDKSKEEILIHCKKELAKQEYRAKFKKDIQGAVSRLIMRNERLREEILDFLIPQQGHISHLFGKKISYNPIISITGKAGVLKQETSINIDKKGQVVLPKKGKKCIEGQKYIIGGISFKEILKAGGIQNFLEQNHILSHREDVLTIKGKVDENPKVKNYEGIYVPHSEDFMKLLSPNINDKDLIVSFINNNGQKYYKIEGVANL